MGAVGVVVTDKLGQKEAQVALATGIRGSRHLRRATLTQRSAIALAFGARIAVRRLEGD